MNNEINVDTESVKTIFSKGGAIFGDFPVNDISSLFEPEFLTNDFANSIATSFNSISDSWFEGESTVVSYLNSVEQIDQQPQPEVQQGIIKGLLDEELNNAPATIVTQGGNLNVRSGPGTNNDVKSSLANGTEVSVVSIDLNSDWVKIRDGDGDGEVGYVNKNYINLDMDSSLENSEVPVDNLDATLIEELPSDKSTDKVSDSAVDDVQDGENHSPNASDSESRAIVNTQGGNLNVRSGKGTNYSIEHTLANKSEVTILESDPNSDWVRIRYGDGEEGYVNKRYIVENTENSSSNFSSSSSGESTLGTSNNSIAGQTSTIEAGYAKVSTNNSALNVRISANGDSAIVGKLENGADVEVLENVGSWTKIKYDGEEAYVYSKYLDF